jgi:hypothetical protein
MGPTALLLLRRKVYYGFLFENPSPSAGIEPANLRSNDKHDRHFTTDGHKEKWNKLQSD